MSDSTRNMGSEAEDLACEFLTKKGWHIVARNYYAGHSEIDIIAQDGDVIVFIEVKMRSSTKFGSPIEHVSESKIERVFQASEQWIQENNAFTSPVRFDIIGILKQSGISPEITHLVDAYR